MKRFQQLNVKPVASNRKRLSILFLLLLLSVFQGYAQIDTAYIGQYRTNMSGRLFFSNKFVSLLHENGINENTYKPNRPLAIGLGITLGKSGLSFSYGFDFMKNNNKGYTNAFDIQYNNYGRKFVFDVIGQWYEGFYNDDTPQGQNYDVYNNMKVLRVGVFGQYVFNNSKFSYAAALKPNEKQLRSAGSLLLGGGVYYSQIHSNLRDFFADPDQSILRTFQFGPSVGYAYTWVFSKSFYLSLSVSAGANIGYDGKKVSVSPSATPRMGLGYQWNDWSVNINYVNNLAYSFYTDNAKIALSSGVIEIGVIRRFEYHPKFLKKFIRNI